MNILDRINIFVQHKEITINKFEITAGLTRGSLRNIKQSIGSEKIALIMQAYPDLNIEWLILGDGDGRTMLNSSNPINKESNTENNDISELILNLSKTISDQQGKISNLTEQLKNEEIINNKLRDEIQLLKSLSKSTGSKKAI